jgi:hypothetical protein
MLESSHFTTGTVVPVLAVVPALAADGVASFSFAMRNFLL